MAKRVRKQIPLKHEKLTVTIRKDILKDLNEFVSEAKNPHINKSSIIQDLLEHALNEDKVLLDKLFPLDKRFKKK